MKPLAEERNHAADEGAADQQLPALACPGQPPPPYTLQSAANALGKIAARMNQDQTRDLRWWHIPQWAPAGARILISGLAVAVVAGLLGGLSGGLAAGLAGALGGGIAAAVAVGLAEIIRDRAPGNATRPRLRHALRRDGFRAGLTAGLPAAIGTGIAVALGAGVILGAAAGLAAGLAAGSAALTDPDSSTNPSPFAAWRNDRNHATLIGLAAGLASGLAIGFTRGPVSGLIVGPAAGLVVGLSSSQAWTCTLAATRLWRRWHTPRI